MQKVITDDLDALVDVLPPHIRQPLRRQKDISDYLLQNTPISLIPLSPHPFFYRVLFFPTTSARRLYWVKDLFGYLPYLSFAYRSVTAKRAPIAFQMMSGARPKRIP